MSEGLLSRGTAGFSVKAVSFWGVQVRFKSALESEMPSALADGVSAACAMQPVNIWRLPHEASPLPGARPLGSILAE